MTDEPFFIANDGAQIADTNYFDRWNAQEDDAIFFSVNAGAIRVLLPARKAAVYVPEMRKASECILSLGSYVDRREGAEVLWEDGSDAPFAIHTAIEAFDLVPGPPPPDKEWVLSVWTKENGTLRNVLTLPCFWRRVPRIPWMKPWKKGT